jgi:hypothetical protein
MKHIFHDYLAYKEYRANLDILELFSPNRLYTIQSEGTDETDGPTQPQELQQNNETVTSPIIVQANSAESAPISSTPNPESHDIIDDFPRNKQPPTETAYDDQWNPIVPQTNHITGTECNDHPQRSPPTWQDLHVESNPRQRKKNQKKLQTRRKQNKPIRLTPVIDGIYNCLQYDRKQVQPEDHWSLPENTYEKQAYNLWFRENKLSLRRTGRPLHYNVSDYVRRVRNHSSELRKREVTQRGKKLWQNFKSTIDKDSSRPRPPAYYTYDKRYWENRAKDLISDEDKFGNFITSPFYTSEDHTHQEQPQQIKKKTQPKTSDKRKRSTEEKRDTNPKPHNTNTNPRRKKAKTANARAQQTNLATASIEETNKKQKTPKPTQGEKIGTTLFNLLALQVEALELGKQHSDLNLESVQALQNLLAKIYCWVRQNHTYENLIDEKATSTYNTLIANSKISQDIIEPIANFFEKNETNTSQVPTSGHDNVSLNYILLSNATPPPEEEEDEQRENSSTQEDNPVETGVHTTEATTSSDTAIASA